MEQNQTLSPPLEGNDIRFLDFAIVIAKHKKKILGAPLFAAVIMASASLFMPDIYTARTVILPPQQGQSSAAAMLSAITGLAGGFGGAFGIKNSNDLYIGMLRSRTVADNIISRFDLMALYAQKTRAGTYKKLNSTVSIDSGKDNLITVEVDDENPTRAADIANAYIDELYKLTNTLAVTEASQRRLFFEKQLALAKDGLAHAEVALKETQEKTGVLELDKQGEAIIKALGELRAQIAAKEVELEAMRTFATDQNPDYVRAKQALYGLKTQLSKLEKGDGAKNGDVFVPTGRVPEVGLEYVRRVRDVKYFETIFELMAKQYEIAKIDEAKDTSIIQVMDRAVVPDKKSRPKRAQMVVLSAVAVAFLTVLLVFFQEFMERARRNSQHIEKLEVLRRYLAWR